MHRVCLVLLLTFVAVGAELRAPLAAQPAATAKPDRIVVQQDAKTLTSDILIEAKDGCVSWSDILVGLARAKGYDDSAFSDLLAADKSLRLNDWSSGWAVFGWNQLLPGGVRLSLLGPKDGSQEPRLKITLNKKLLLASKRLLFKQFRDAVTRAVGPLFPGLPKEYGLKLDKGWAATPLVRPLVVLIPGFQASLKFNDPCAAWLRDQGFHVGDFRYPNDQGLDDSAEMLASALQAIAKEQPKRKICIIGHSMGGLVARRVLEDARLDPGNVSRLLMVCTPNHGSQLAIFGFGLELWEHLVDQPQNHVLKTFFATVEDGLGEAAEDLEPGSVFLHALNAKPRNPKVQYSLLLGDKGLISDIVLMKLRAEAPQIKSFSRWIKFFGPKLDALLADLDEVVVGKGDGAVALARGKLAGVADTVILAIDHTAIGHEPATPAEHQLRVEILKRLSGAAK